MAEEIARTKDCIGKEYLLLSSGENYAKTGDIKDYDSKNWIVRLIDKVPNNYNRYYLEQII